VDPRLRLALKIAREAGKLTLEFFRRPDLLVETKADASPVTVADRRAEDHLRRCIRAAFPEDGILGEEFGAEAGTSEFRWIVDPIDGTKSFVRGVPLYGTLIGIERAGRAVGGVIHLPAAGETVVAGQGDGAWWLVDGRDPVPARVSGVEHLGEALYCTTDPGTFDEIDRPDAHESLKRAVRLSRTWGDCAGYLLVATGRAEIMVDPLMNAWDAAAVLPVLAEAGGRFTDWTGDATAHGGNGVATNGKLHAGVLDLLQSRRVEESAPRPGLEL
jgi:histidinol phosphatase-like enzyme (inositol monophosphatase family)